jgi:hypothetical protein
MDKLFDAYIFKQAKKMDLMGTSTLIAVLMKYEWTF